MYRYVLKRLVLLIPVLLGVSFVVYTILDFAPGDPARLVLGSKSSEAAREEFREEHGLNKPFVVRYVSYVGKVVQGDFGKSYRTGRDVSKELLNRLPATVVLAATGVLFAIILSIPLGIVSAIKQHSAVDNVGMFVALFGITMPEFWLGLMLILLFSSFLGILPSGGYGSFANLILPALTVGMPCMANLTRVTRSEMLGVMREDFVRMARAKGVAKRVVIMKHCLKNALIPVITVAGLLFGTLLGGTVIVENVFGWPGVGAFLVKSITMKDIPAVMGGVMLLALLFSLVNLAVDIIYAFIDPRIKAEYSNRRSA
ncbi:MAG: ABC transporter permease [Clostridiales Family XIII bacterium]|jgi:peptide/nickel transport system permease protein|nr:ABC transporter permease [Clostridiales Family XIII bacterium]